MTSAAHGGNAKIVKILLDNGINTDFWSICYAAEKGNLDVVKLFLASGICDVNYQENIIVESMTDIKTRSDCSNENYLSKLMKSTGVFISGGNQLRLSTILGGTPVAKAIRRLNADGVHIAGTSAGAAIMPEHMISGGRSGGTPTPKSVSLSPGLGLTNSVVIDQHFRQRDRLGRLLAAIAYSPFLTGVGIDENTAIFIDPDNTFSVEGSGAVTIVDPSKMNATSASIAGRNDAINITDITLHILASGSNYDLNSHTALVMDSDTDTLE